MVRNQIIRAVLKSVVEINAVFKDSAVFQDGIQLCPNTGKNLLDLRSHLVHTGYNISRGIVNKQLSKI